MSSKVDAVLRLREAGAVERCHTLPIAGRRAYTVDVHVYNMLALIFVLHPDPPLALIRAVMYHDASERWIGDLPGSLKYLAKELADTVDVQKKRIEEIVGYAPIMNALTDDEKKWLKAVDRIEFLMWTEDQIAMGNRHVGGRLDAVKAQLLTTPMPAECQAFLDSYHWHRTADNAVR